MPVFTDTQMTTLYASIRNTLNEHLDHEECDVTVDDLLNVFVRPEHHDAARLAPELYLHRMYGGQAFSFKHKAAENSSPIMFTVSLQYTYDQTKNKTTLPWVPPSYAGDAMIEGSPAYEKLVWYMARVHKLFSEYNNMAMLLATLNNRCATAGQMAFVWPGITQLVDRADKRGEKVDTLKKMVSRRNTAGCPIVTPAMREICKESGATLSYLQLVGTAKPRRDRLGFEIGFGTDVSQIMNRDAYAAL